MSRNDIHSPSNVVMENYSYRFAFDNHAHDNLARAAAYGMPSAYLVEMARNLTIASNAVETSPLADRGVWQCHHCGARIRYGALLAHDNGESIVVGETCMENRFDRSTAEFQALRKQAELDRATQRIRKAVAEFVEANPDLAWMGIRKYEDRIEAMPENSRNNGFLNDLARKLNSYGELSDKQVACIRPSMARDDEYAARKAAEAAAKETEVVVDVVEGRIEIQGVILSTKWQDSQYGGAWKMLVKDDRGFKVWGTVPSSIEGNRGDTVKFMAQVTASDDDKAFGFFSRPTKAQTIKEGE